jgi:hypothetical protein
MIRSWQRDAGGSHFPHNLASRIPAEPEQIPDLAERCQTLILIASQDRHHRSPGSEQEGKDGGRHAFPIHNDPAHLSRFDDPFIVRDEEGQSDRHMRHGASSRARDDPAHREAERAHGIQGLYSNARLVLGE